MKYSEKAKPRKGGRYRYLFPYFSPPWRIDYNRRAPHGVPQEALTRLKTLSGSPELLTLRIDRTWFSTCGRHLLFCLEDRAELRHWGEGIKITNLYEREVFATELNLRNEIWAQIHAGRAPAHAFEIPNDGANAQESNPTPLAESSMDTTSVTATAPNLKREIDISNLDVE